MSNLLRRYPSIITAEGSEIPVSVNDLTISAFVGPDGMPCLQFTIGDQHCCLAPNQIRNLIRTSFMRLASKPGFTAVGIADYRVVHGTENVTRASRKEEKKTVKMLEGKLK
jgi:hypothetical protein